MSLHSCLLKSHNIALRNLNLKLIFAFSQAGEQDRLTLLFRLQLKLPQV